MTSRPRDVVVIGGSAGAVEALTGLLGQLPAGLEAAIAVVLHRHPSFASKMAAVFGRCAKLEVIEPEHGTPFKRGRVHLAPPDRHMLVSDEVVHLNREPRQNHTRPAIDPLFRSAARSYGRRVIGVLLTGNLSDGVGGLIDIKAHGGLSLVQDPGEAPFPSMPRNALIYDHVDGVFTIEGLPRLLERLVAGESVASALGTRGTRPVRDSDTAVPSWLAPGRRLP